MGRGRTARAGCCALALAALSSVTAPARAASELGIPAQCGSRASFDAELVKRLGDDIPLDDIVVSISQATSGFHLRVQVKGELRELDDESCTELFRAAIVVAVAMLMHDRTSSEASSQPPPEPRATVAVSSRPRITLAIGAGASIGTLSKAVFSAELESKALWRNWGVGLGLRYLTPGEKRDAFGRGVRLQAVGAGAVGIYRPSRAWEARLGFAAQYLFGEGLAEAVPTFQSQKGAAWAAGPTLGLGFIPFEQPPFWLGVGAEGQLNLLRGHFEILNYSGEIHDVPWLSGAGFVRLGLSW